MKIFYSFQFTPYDFLSPIGVDIQAKKMFAQKLLLNIDGYIFSCTDKKSAKCDNNKNKKSQRLDWVTKCVN